MRTDCQPFLGIVLELQFKLYTREDYPLSFDDQNALKVLLPSEHLQRVFQTIPVDIPEIIHGKSGNIVKVEHPGEILGRIPHTFIGLNAGGARGNFSLEILEEYL